MRSFGPKNPVPVYLIADGIGRSLSVNYDQPVSTMGIGSRRRTPHTMHGAQIHAGWVKNHMPLFVETNMTMLSGDV